VALDQVTRPQVVDGQRAAALPPADPRVQALLHTLLLFVQLPGGSANKDSRPPLAALLGHAPGAIAPGMMSYDLRRLRLHGLIARLPGTHRYPLTPLGLRTAGMAHLAPPIPPADPALRPYFTRLEAALDRCIHHAHFAA
jgi:hypothetical protein